MPGPALYLFAGGGTGGHLTPGLAVAERLRQIAGPSSRIVFAGTDRTLERTLVTQAGFEHFSLPVESSLSLRQRPWRFVWRNWRAYRHCRCWLLAERPRAVIGLGGFASAPFVWAGIRLKFPTILLEQNSVPGRVTRIFGPRASGVCVAFAETRAQLSPRARVVVTGNPVRRTIADMTTTESVAAPDVRPTILILGGSQGAAPINEAMMRLSAMMPARFRKILFVHQTGPAQADMVRAAYRRAGLEHVIEPFFGELAPWYRQATLVVSRAGATTLAELACAGCPALLVPYPHAADDHQRRNAELFVQTDAARLVPQLPDPTATASAILRAMNELFDDEALLEKMRRGMRSLARPDATERVVELLQSLPCGAMT